MQNFRLFPGKAEPKWSHFDCNHVCIFFNTLLYCDLVSREALQQFFQAEPIRGSRSYGDRIVGEGLAASPLLFKPAVTRDMVPMDICYD